MAPFYIKFQLKTFSKNQSKLNQEILENRVYFQRDLSFMKKLIILPIQLNIQLLHSLFIVLPLLDVLLREII